MENDEKKFESRKSYWFAIKTVLLSIVIVITSIIVMIFVKEDFALYLGIGGILLGICITMFRILVLSSDRIVFYEKIIVRTNGFFSRRETSIPITKFLAVNINQTFLGRILNYGDIMIDMVGKWDTTFLGIKNPRRLKAYIESIIDDDSYQDIQSLVVDK